VTAVGFRKVAVSGDGLCRRLEKRNEKKIAAGLITVGYIVTFPFAWQQAAKNKNRSHVRKMIHKDYINSKHAPWSRGIPVLRTGFEGGLKKG
jgi:uncharacterized membrane protein